jgi:hypothetical protein
VKKVTAQQLPLMRLKNAEIIPPGFVLHHVHRCPVNEQSPTSSNKWTLSLREDKHKGRLFSGADQFYETPEEALIGAVAAVKTRLEKRKKLQRSLAPKAALFLEEINGDD